MPARSEKTKNGVCKNFLHSVCRMDVCPYIHDKSRADRCKHFMQNNSCNKGDNCDFRHDMDADDQTKLVCKYFSKNGECQKGSKCPFLHERSYCKPFSRGFCPAGPACRNTHEVKKGACPNYLLGFCPRGPDCQLAHHKMFFEIDKAFFERMNPDFKIVRCNKCKEIGHKSNNCERGGDKENMMGGGVDYFPKPPHYILQPPPPPPSTGIQTAASSKQNDIYNI